MKTHHPKGHAHPAPTVIGYIHHFPPTPARLNESRYGLVIWGGNQNGYLCHGHNVEVVIDCAVKCGAQVIYIH